ncbi:Crp/Fnr family transcriptional regulator [Olivibacter sp. SDN3]|uniref:Crp/Fnr family transcriptional regulator n=1 Tax=Olivibacter sp. SDN3 TaxID=2764720 RepID=UPI00165131EE|nr:Crp/Fnr family transcriptional regulator [Olivibacter sp. SDN3]QNL48061.1 Crp/Fnr family transcriptional regulator [Olivibacter sp. SDN3]
MEDQQKQSATYDRLMQSIALFIRTNEEEKKIIPSLFVPRQYGKNDYFLRQGDVCRHVGFINQGLIRYYMVKDSGEELTLDFGKETEFTCNYESFLDQSVSAVSIQCLEPSEILVISYENLQLLYDKVTQGQKFGRLICEQLYIHAMKKVRSFYADEPEERYLQFTHQYPGLQQRVPQYHIASFVGVKPPSLSRIRKRLSSFS